MELYKVLTPLMLILAMSAYGSCNQNEVEGIPFSGQVQNILSSQESISCAQKRNFYSQPKKDLDSQLRVHNIVNPQIMLMSVEHWNYEEVTYPRFIEAMKRKGRDTDCFLLERSVSPEEAIFIQDINEGKKVDWVSVGTSFNVPLLKYLQSHGIKIHPVDTDAYDDLEDDEVAWLNARDENFSKEIKRLLAPGKCKSPFFPVGGAHLASGVMGRKTLADLLLRENISTFKTGLLVHGVRSADENVTPGIGSHWLWGKTHGVDISSIGSVSRSDLLCSSFPELTSDEIYTISSGSNTAPTFYDSNNFMGHQRDADFWMVYTCQTHSCKDNNRLIETELRKKGFSFY